MIDHTADAATVRGRRACVLVQIHQHAWKPDDFEVACLDGRTAHRYEDLFVRFDVARVHMPVPVGHAGGVDRERLRRRKGRHEQGNHP
jgi:hypothetical protein